MLFKTKEYYIRVTKTLLEIRDINTDKRFSKKVINSYSNERLLISDFDSFAKQLNSLIADFEDGKLILSQRTMIFHPIDESISEFSTVEKRSFRDACEHAGARNVYFVFGEIELNNRQLKIGLNGTFER
jgi:capsule polysaccharide modification protein KpsS